MANPKARIQELLSSSQGWAHLIAMNPDVLTSRTEDETDPVLLTLPNGDSIPVAFIVQRLLCALGEIDELLVCHASFWPGSRDWIEKVRKQVGIEALLPVQVAQLGADEVATRLWHIADGLSSGYEDVMVSRSPILQEVFNEFLEVRNEILRRSASIPGRTQLMLEGANPSPFWSRWAQLANVLGSDDRSRLESLLKTYLSNSWVFPWLNYWEEESVGWNRYAVLYAFMGGREMGLESTTLEDMRRALREARLPDELVEIVGQMLNRMSQAISDGYDVFREAVFDNDGQWGGGSMTGSPEPINLIPSTGGKMACTRIALALAQGNSSRSRHGFVRVMREVRAHLISCFQTTQVVILLTDVWDPKLIEESRADIAAHQASGHIILPVLVSGGRLSLVPWP